MDRKSKYTRKRNSTEEDKKFILSFDINVLNLFCSFVMSKNRTIKKSNLIALRTLFSEIHPDSFKNDPDKLARVQFINRALEARIEKRLDNQTLILAHANGGLLKDDIIAGISEFSEMSNAEIEYVNLTVSKCLKNSYFNAMADKFRDLADEYRGTDYKDRDPLIDKFETAIGETSSYFRRVKNDNTDTGYFCLKKEVMDSKVREFYDQLASPSNKLKTGMVGMNELLNGGFESGRCYLFFGLQGEGKSTTLLNLAYQIKKYNTNYQLKDPTKIPCILYLTQENSERETFERLYNITTKPDNVVDSTPDLILRDMVEEGKLTLTGDNPIDLIIKYKAGGTCDTTYLYSLIDDLEDDGYEVICVIQDYVKRIHCEDPNLRKDIRLELGEVVNDFHRLAEFKDIPVISASQLNRDATSRIDEGRQKNKADLLRLIGRSNIGESMLMLDNADGSFIIAPEMSVEGYKFLGIQTIKTRYRSVKRSHIYQPYSPDCAIKLLEDDMLAEPLFKDTLRPANPMSQMNGGNHIAPVKSSLQLTSITNLDDGVMLRNDNPAPTNHILANRLTYSSAPNNAAGYRANVIQPARMVTPMPFSINPNYYAAQAAYTPKTPLPFDIIL